MPDDNYDTFQALRDIDDAELRARLAREYGLADGPEGAPDAFCQGRGFHAQLNRAISGKEVR